MPQVVSHERGETVTLCAFVNAIGNTVPPCLIFPRKRFYDRMITGAPPGTLGLSSPSGCMTTELFLECLRHFVKHVRCSKTERALLLLDNRESHVSIEATDFCRDNGIILLTFPPHCSHRLQPLDRTVFGPFKTFYYKSCNEWMYNHPSQRLSIHDVAGIVGKAFPRAFTISNILSGFQATGISPFDSDIFTGSDFIQSSVTDRPCQQEVTEGESQPSAEDDMYPAAPVTTQTQPPAAANDQPGTPITTQTQTCTNDTGQAFSPELVRPFPKAGARKQTKRKSRP